MGDLALDRRREGRVRGKEAQDIASSCYHLLTEFEFLLSTIFILTY